jgi:alkanesulfonate monooxygenase SsuD/methylene tetrahydromethanopterin reductase-like flavin-dependent oxidoreductase (luciferase family)
VDLLLQTFGVRWSDLHEGARLAEQAGFDGIWVNDHLSGSVEHAPYVLECWTVLSALAADVPRITVGPLVLNGANRDTGTLAVMAATLQQVSEGRLLLGLGAGAKAGSKYAIEQEALRRPVPDDAERRRGVERTVALLREVWSGAVPPVTGFLQPDPVPPIVVAATGPKMAALAGRAGDGVCVPVGAGWTELIAVARGARRGSDRDQTDLLVTALLSSWPGPNLSLLGSEVDRLIVSVTPPFDQSIARLANEMERWRTDAV